MQVCQEDLVELALNTQRTCCSQAFVLAFIAVGFCHCDGFVEHCTPPRLRVTAQQSRRNLSGQIHRVPPSASSCQQLAQPPSAWPNMGISRAWRCQMQLTQCLSAIARIGELPLRLSISMLFALFERTFPQGRAAAGSALSRSAPAQLPSRRHGYGGL